MEVTVISPEGEVFRGQADAVALPGGKGGFEVLNAHAPIVSTLEKGDVVIRNGKGFDKAFFAEGVGPDSDGRVVLEISSGVAKVSDNRLLILID